MSLILHIDTATEYGAVAISNSDLIIAVDENNNQKEHASFLHPAIDLVVKKAGVSLEEIEAISVTIGPGSYTGLRVGLTAAKGLCFVLRKPLITVDTLKAMALASIENSDFIEPVLFAPMIDARRMEVYTGLYTSNADLYRAAQALILSDDIFAEEMKEYSIVFSGNGSKKMQTAFNNDKFLFIDVIHNIKHIMNIAYKQFINKKFEDPAYCEPIYLKPFYTTAIVKK